MVLSSEAKDWLDKWVHESKRLELPTAKIIKEFSKFKPTKPIVLHRGINKKEDVAVEPLKKLKSYTHEVRLAQTIACGDPDEPYTETCEGIVESRVVAPSEILIDFTKLPKELQDEKGYINEVIVVKKWCDEDRTKT